MEMESHFNQEVKEVTRRQVIEKIIANPEDRDLLGQFVDQLQSQVERGEISDLDFNIELAELYEEATQKNPFWQEFASQSYYDAAIIANQMGEKDLQNELLTKSKEFLD